MKATLFTLPGSHPSWAARLMLERKGIEYRRIDFAPGVHRVLLRAVGFKGRTVPALRLDGKRIQRTRNISRELDAIRPEPPLFPADPARREAVERAEEWGDEVLQSAARRLVWAALKRDRSTLDTFLADARLGMPVGLAVRTAPPLVRLSARLNGVSDETARADLAALPEMLDRVDGWIADGVIGAAEPNAADFQIAPSIRLLMTLEDLRAGIEQRPAGRLAARLVPTFPGRLGRVFPGEWLAPLQAARA